MSDANVKACIAGMLIPSLPATPSRESPKWMIRFPIRRQFFYIIQATEQNVQSKLQQLTEY